MKREMQNDIEENKHDEVSSLDTKPQSTDEVYSCGDTFSEIAD